MWFCGVLVSHCGFALWDGVCVRGGSVLVSVIRICGVGNGDIAAFRKESKPHISEVATDSRRDPPADLKKERPLDR